MSDGMMMGIPQLEMLALLGSQFVSSCYSLCTISITELCFVTCVHRAHVVILFVTSIIITNTCKRQRY